MQPPAPGRASQRLLTVASLAVVIAALKLGAGLLVPFAAAFFLALLSLPLLTWLEEHRVPRWLAVTLAVLANLAMLAIVGVLLSASFSSFVTAAPKYRDQLSVMIDDAVAWGESRGLPAARWVEEGLFDAASVVDLIGGTLRGAVSLATDLLLVVTLMVFILLEVAIFPAKLQAALGNRVQPRWRYALIRLEVQRYLMMKSLVSAFMGVLTGLGVWAIGLDFALLWGLLAFFFNYVPNIGPIIAAVPALVVSLITLGVAPTLLVALLYLALHLGLGNLLEPQLFGRRLGLSPLVVFVSLIFWGWAWGPIGMLLSVPLTVIARIVFENSRELRWVAVLLSSEPPGEEEGEEREEEREPPPRAPPKREAATAGKRRR
ncbi:MAG TPA: AI-2E family transporter [Thermoanaerobaculia bacterium]|jgi:predicted PurR-regulated permease PerM|nr:AI-2E family transporter [Thermoanaerobaculia bacterium]